MSLDKTASKPATSATLPGSADTSLHGRWLILARLVWVILVVCMLVLFATSMSAYYAALHVISPPDGSGLGLTANEVRQLQEMHLSLDFYAWYQVLSGILTMLIYATVGIVVFWRKSNDRMALLVSFVLVSFPVALNTNSAVRALPPVWQLPANGIEFFIDIAIALFFYVFPDGRFLPRWTRWLMVVNIFYWFLGVFFPNAPITQSWPVGFLFLPVVASYVVAQVYRYWRISTPVQRQQTKWVIFGIAITFGGFLIVIGVLYALLPLFLPVTPLYTLLSDLIGQTILPFVLLFFPISVAIAILRSGLWEIDTLINRTLVYSILTVLLASVYVGSILLLQFLLRGFTGGNSLAIVTSTLAIAALFQPLRRRIQNIIDRRFYRRKYDAARTLAAFGATLRNEVDLNQLREQLLSVVQETMQPAHVSLWLRPSEHDGKQQAPWRTTPPVSSEER
ncbi:MAG TPA: hypothetical protein VKR83_10935 [Ktedonobacteraceae bacterium]|nr:hypothetical protein [Ktedonobacteraceae bacterium]